MEVDDQAFQPVNIKVGGRYHVVATVADAYRLMVTEWPLKEAPALYRAEVTCLDAFNDVATPEDVRKKFLIAASEAHLQYVV
jgi:hypothetical protein